MHTLQSKQSEQALGGGKPTKHAPERMKRVPGTNNGTSADGVAYDASLPNISQVPIKASYQFCTLTH